MGERLTKEDIAKIEEEIEMRKTELRPKLLEDLKSAREQGDLSENFEYYAAKRAKNKNESRIRYLERIIAGADILEDTLKADQAGVGKIVKIYIEDDDCEEEYRIVTSMRADSIHDIVSIESPLGKALIGHKVGDRVYVQVKQDFGYYVVIREISIDENSDDIAIREY
ncbi:MAG TPA: transcription elongation factor GreA [Eubacterium sp.]|nr:transcription elongation factor GreA [Lachnospiraceae bacterium]HBZ53269.1 transcription elongation factor GreA [Eubacterium sp.]